MPGKDHSSWLQHLNRRNENSPRGFLGSGLKNYEWRKRAWMLANPDSTPEAYSRAMQEIAKECGV